jgi:hypothetical protein
MFSRLLRHRTEGMGDLVSVLEISHDRSGWRDPATRDHFLADFRRELHVGRYFIFWCIH